MQAPVALSSPVLQMITEYPSPVCDRITPVPSSDLTWINLKHGKDYPALGKDEQTRGTSQVPGPMRNTYPLLSKPVALRTSDGYFPSAEDFIKARKAIGAEGVVPATVKEIDAKILDNHVGYSRADGGEAYYFQTQLSLPCVTKGGKRHYVGRQYLSVFTEAGYPGNSIHSIVETLAWIRSCRANKDKVDKGFLTGLLWLAASIYGVLNRRCLEQTPGDDAKYDVADQAYLLAFFEQRDCSVRLDFENKVLRPALDEYKTLDMVKFAMEHNFAEFFWLMCGFARCMATEMKLEIFPDAALVKFSKNDFHEHWPTYLSASHVREVKVPGLVELLNKRASELSAHASANSKFKVLRRDRRKTKNGFSIVDTWRVTNSRTKTPSLQFGKGELQAINWPGFLGKYSLLAWSGFDPSRPAWDTSQAHFKYRYKDPERFVRDVGVAQFLGLHGSFAVTATDQFKPHQDAFPLVNTCRLAYTMFSNKNKRLCVTPPLAVTHPTVVALPITSPLNIQYPCWKWLVERAIGTEAPEPDDSKRRHHRLHKRESKAPHDKVGEATDLIEIGDGSEMCLASKDPAIVELFGPAKIDLLWRVQMVRSTGFFDLYPMRHRLLRDPEPPADFTAQPPWNSKAGPLPGTFDMAAFRQAAYMRLNNHPGLSAEGDLCDQPVNCWHLYRTYLQGCVLYVNEIDVIRHVLVMAFGSIEAFTAACAKGYANVFNGMLINLQWGERLWRSVLFTSTIDGINELTAPVTRELRKKFLSLYPTHRRSGMVAQLVNETFATNTRPDVAQSALLQRPAFWKELVNQYETVAVSGDIKVPVAEWDDLLEEVAKGEVDSETDAMAGEVILQSHILPNVQCTSWAMRYEHKSPMAIFNTKRGLFQALHSIATRRFIQPLCLLASTMYPSNEALLYTSPIDGKVSKWGQLTVPSEKEPLVISIGRQIGTVTKTALEQATEDVDWKAESKAVTQQGDMLSTGLLLAMATLFTEPAVVGAYSSNSALATDAQKNKKKTAKKNKSPSLPASEAMTAEEKEMRAFINVAKDQGMRLVIDRVAKHILQTSLAVVRPQGQPHHVDAEALQAVIGLFGQTNCASSAIGAERRAFEMLRLTATDAQMMCTRKKLGDKHPALLNKLQMHLAAKGEESQVKSKKPEHKAAAPVQTRKSPDLTARKNTQPEMEDFAAQDEDAQFMIAGLTSSSNSNSKRAFDGYVTEPARKKTKTSDGMDTSSNSNSNSNNSAPPPKHPGLGNPIVWG